MTNLLEFAGGLLDALGLVAFSLLLGGLAYALVVLQVQGRVPPGQSLLKDRCFQVVLRSGVVLLLLRLLQLSLKYFTLGQVMEASQWNAFLDTQLFRSGLMSVGMIGLLVGAVHWLSRAPRLLLPWSVVGVCVCGLLASETQLTHAASRLENRQWLMMLTMVHGVGATVWAGGVGHLLLSWWAVRQHSLPSFVWPPLVARFSYLGIPCMVLIVGPGVLLAWWYVGSVNGLLGTGYGNMVLAKIGFLLLVLLLAILNWRAGRHWRRAHDLPQFTWRVSAYVEVEILLAIGLLFTATSLTGFPPAVDVMRDAAAPADMWMMFSPKMPRVIGPEVVLIDAPELTDLQTGEMGKKEDSSWDRFNHNVSGAIVIAMAVIAILDCLGRVEWARRWPLLFVAFSLLIFVFANPDHWPLGLIGFRESVQSTEVVQHWLAACVVFGLGWFEWQAREHTYRPPMAKFMFPGLCMVGGIILLTHSHSISALKTEFLVQSTHVSMGFLGVVMGCARWLELRLPEPQARLAGLVSIGSMLLVGFILLFYLNPEFPELSPAWNGAPGSVNLPVFDPVLRE